MDDPWIDRISEYLDDELSRRERRAFEEHARLCARCSAAVDATRAVIAHARALNSAVEPARDLWPDIAGRLKPREAAGGGSWLRGALFWPKPLIATAALVAIVSLAGVVWLLHGRSYDFAQHGVEGGARVTTEPPGRAELGTHGPGAYPTESRSDQEYDAQVARLQREARARLTLDPHVVEVLDENLATLDAAIATYRDALSEEPGNGDLQARLNSARERKLQVLQQAVALAPEGTN